MKFAPVSNNRRRAGYTLAETLAALLFLAIVIPAVVEALHVASRAGTASIRRAVAARIAERMLTEATLYTNSSATQSGTQGEGTVALPDAGTGVFGAVLHAGSPRRCDRWQQ